MGERPPTQLQLRVPGDRHAPGLARRAVEAFAAWLDEDSLERARLLVSELVANSVRHAGMGPLDTLEISVTLDASLRVEVRDGGRGFPGAGHPRHDLRGGAEGLGFLLLDALASRWGVEHGPPTVVWFETQGTRPRLRVLGHG
jgi:anti-sigma regulatory factor (Ser/Thr protein kinase)